MTIKKFFRTRPGQRVDQPDFEHVADATPRSVTEQIGRHVLTGSDSASNYVLEGFATTVSSPTITVDGGIAVVGYRDRGELRQGALATGGPASRSINISTYPAGTYNVYVTLVVEDAEFLNRPFWDSLASPAPVEVVRNTATRRTENWAIAVEATSPGDEWMRVAQVVKNGAGTVGAPTDLREFYFEGRAGTSPTSYLSEWGGGNDRNANRALYGIKSLRAFARAVLGQLHAIIGGPNGWWNIPPASLTGLTNDKLARDGTQPMLGNLLPNTDNNLDLGSGSFRWQDLFAVNANFNALTTVNGGTFTASAGVIPALANNRSIILRGTATTATDEFRIIYQNSGAGFVGSPAIEVAINASWDFNLSAGAYRWSAVNTSAEAFLYVLSRGGFYIYRRGTTTSPWLDTAAAGGWTLLHRLNEVAADFTGAPITYTAALAATELELGVNAPITPVANTIYANTLVLARGTVTADGAGGYTIGSGFNAGVNFSVAQQGAGARITFATGVGSGSYQVLLTTATQNAVMAVNPVAKTATYFDVDAFTATTGGTRNLNTVGSPTTFDFIVVGG